jgi:hypothetical protein
MRAVSVQPLASTRGAREHLVDFCLTGGSREDLHLVHVSCEVLAARLTWGISRATSLADVEPFRVHGDLAGVTSIDSSITIVQEKTNVLAFQSKASLRVKSIAQQNGAPTDQWKRLMISYHRRLGRRGSRCRSGPVAHHRSGRLRRMQRPPRCDPWLRIHTERRAHLIRTSSCRAVHARSCVAYQVCALDPVLTPPPRPVHETSRPMRTSQLPVSW